MILKKRGVGFWTTRAVEEIATYLTVQMNAEGLVNRI
jgi:hypothetical protein